MAKASITMTIPDKINIDLDELTKNEILNNIKEASSEVIDKNIEVDWNTLKSQAQKFLSSILALEKQRARITSQQIKRQLLSNPAAANILNNQKINKDRLILQSEYMLAFQFDDYLNRFRQEEKDRKALYVTVDKNGQIMGTYEISLQELVLNASKTGRLDISNKNLSSENKRALEKQKGYFEENHVIEALMAYNGTVARLNRFYEKHKGKQKQGGLLMWKDSDKWKVGTVLNTGDLKEAYVSFLFDKHKNNLCTLAGGNPPFYSHEFIGGFYRNYINKVTNLAAIVEEDIITDNAQYAVKGVAANLPSLGQFIDTAIWIINQDKILTKAEIESYLDTEFRSKEVKRNLEYDLKEVSEKEVMEILESLQEQFG